MNFMKFAAMVTVLSTVGVAAAAQSFSDIYGRTLVSDQGRIMINANGSMSGEFNGQDFSGRWWTDGGNFCREGTVGGTPFGPACQTISMSGNRITFTTVDGARTTSYRIE